MIPKEYGVYSLTPIPLSLQAHMLRYATIPTSECFKHLRLTVSNVLFGARSTFSFYRLPIDVGESYVQILRATYVPESILYFSSCLFHHCGKSS